MGDFLRTCSSLRWAGISRRLYTYIVSIEGYFQMDMHITRRQFLFIGTAAAAVAPLIGQSGVALHKPHSAGKHGANKEMRTWKSNELAHNLLPRDRLSISRNGPRRSVVSRSALVSDATVTFEPGARTAWHTHPRGGSLPEAEEAQALCVRCGSPCLQLTAANQEWALGLRARRGRGRTHDPYVERGRCLHPRVPCVGGRYRLCQPAGHARTR
jgi:hypothetical protein